MSNCGRVCNNHQLNKQFKLSEAREAFRHFGAGGHHGKVVIAMV